MSTPESEEVISFETFLQRVRSVGVAVADTSSTLSALPSLPKDQWEILKPYIGKPLKAIPRGLILLFTEDPKIVGTLTKKLRLLPVAERQQVVWDESEEIFI